eukprot:Em0027g10a
MQTGFEMKTLARTAEKGANNLLHSISLNSSFVAALEEQLNNLLDFTRRHVAEVRTRLKLGVVTKEELYHLGDVLLSLQSTLIRGLQDLRDLADVFDNLNGNSNAASDFLQSLDVLEKRIAWRTISPVSSRPYTPSSRIRRPSRNYCGEGPLAARLGSRNTAIT